jgi:hypothetical protein
MMVVADARPVLVFLALLGGSVWIGGFVAIVVVTRIARAQLERRAQIEFFRALGRRYLVVGNGALVVGLAAGGVLLADHAWDGVVLAALIVAAGVVLVTAAGIVQARRLSRLRARAMGDEALAPHVRRRAMQAGMLRGAIGLLSVALLALAAVLAGS